MTTRTRGRPSKFSPAIRKKILACLRAGSTVKATCDSVGVGVSTYFEWLEIGRAHLSGTSHARMPRKVAERDDYAEFAEATTRATANGLVHAAAAFRRGMNASQGVSTITETIEETRLDKEGKPYAYRKMVVRETVEHVPGDWRAAMEYLARRDPENWARTNPQKHEHSGEVGLSWKDVIKAAEEYDAERGDDVPRAKGDWTDRE